MREREEHGERKEGVSRAREKETSRGGSESQSRWWAFWICECVTEGGEVSEENQTQKESSWRYWAWQNKQGGRLTLAGAACFQSVCHSQLDLGGRKRRSKPDRSVERELRPQEKQKRQVKQCETCIYLKGWVSEVVPLWCQACLMLLPSLSYCQLSSGDSTSPKMATWKQAQRDRQGLLKKHSQQLYHRVRLVSTALTPEPAFHLCGPQRFLSVSINSTWLLLLHPVFLCYFLSLAHTHMYRQLSFHPGARWHQIL